MLLLMLSSVTMSNIVFVIGCFAALSTTVLASRKCDNLGILVYDDMNCKPIIRKGNSCPSKYECPDMGKTDDKCYFRGNSYDPGQHVNSSDTFCQVGCSCRKGNEGMEFGCAILECAQFGPPLPEGCYYKYSLDKCCGGRYCPTKPVHKCTYDGEEYREGERFFPKDSCTMCLCQKGFNGEIEKPFCIQRQCEGQIKFLPAIQKYCAPVYNYQTDRENGISCCPREYTCPDGTEIVTGKATSSDECRYGDKTLKVGQQFKKEIPKVVGKLRVLCECKVPPLVSCVLDA